MKVIKFAKEELKKRADYIEWLNSTSPKDLQSLQAEIVMLKSRLEVKEKMEAAPDLYENLLAERNNLLHKLGQPPIMNQQEFLKMNVWEKMKLTDAMAGKALDDAEEKCEALNGF